MLRPRREYAGHEVEPAIASPSCPRCGATSPPGESRCRRCGFPFFEAVRQRRMPRPSGSVLVGLAAVAAATAGATALLTGGNEPARRTVPVADRAFPRRPPSPVPALEAERLLELRYGGTADDEPAEVACPHRIDPNATIRCVLRYRDGVPRALLVRLSPRGDLEADVPYPATLR